MADIAQAKDQNVIRGNITDFTPERKAKLDALRGVPAGGDAGEVLVKESAADGDFGWGSGGDQEVQGRTRSQVDAQIDAKLAGSDYVGTDQIADEAVTIGEVSQALRDRLMPAGGTQGQVLAKTADADFAAGWEDATGGGTADSVAWDNVTGKPDFAPSNAEANPAAATQPEAEAGILAALKSWSPLRVAQAAVAACRRVFRTDGDALAYTTLGANYALTSGHAATTTFDTRNDLPADAKTVRITGIGLTGSASISADDLRAKPDVAPGIRLDVTNRLNDAIAFTLQSRQYYLAKNGTDLILADGQVAETRTFTFAFDRYRLRDFADRAKTAKVGYDDVNIDPTSTGVSNSGGALKFTAGQAGSGEANPAAATQAEAEAGTEPMLRSWSPQRVAQAIAALAVRTTSLAWAAVTGKPATATRWPSYAEVTGTKPPADAEQNVNADWNATSGDAEILNKPDIPEEPMVVTAFPVPPVRKQGLRVILTREDDETRDHYIVGQGYQNGTVIFTLGGHGGDAVAIIAYDGDYATTALQNKVFVQYSGEVPAGNDLFNRLYFYEPTGVRSDGTFTVNTSPQAGFPHLFEVNNLHATALTDGAGYNVNLETAAGDFRFAPVRRHIGAYVYDSTEGWEPDPLAPAAWARQGQPNPAAPGAFTRVHHGPGIGISVADATVDHYSPALTLFSPALNYAAEGNRQGILFDEGVLTIGTPASGVFFERTNGPRSHRIKGWASGAAILATPDWTAGATVGVEVDSVEVWGAANKYGTLHFYESHDGSDDGGYYFRFDSDGYAGAVAFSVGLTLTSIYDHTGAAAAALAFTGLTDTPAAYTGQGGKHVAVNAGATALEFVDAPTGGGGGTVAVPADKTFSLAAASGTNVNRKTVAASTGAVALSDFQALALVPDSDGGDIGVTATAAGLAFAQSGAYIIEGSLEFDANTGGGASRLYCDVHGALTRGAATATPTNLMSSTFYNKTAVDDDNLEQGPGRMHGEFLWLFEAQAGDALAFNWRAYIQTSTRVDIVAAMSNVVVRKIVGAKGDKGDPGIAGARFVATRQPGANVNVGGSGTTEAWSGRSTLIAFPAITAEQAGQIQLVGAVNGFVTAAPSADNLTYCNIRIVRTRSGSPTTLFDVYPFGLNKSGSGLTAGNTRIFSLGVNAADVAQAGDVYTVDARAQAEVADVTVRFLLADNRVSMIGV